LYFQDAEFSALMLRHGCALHLLNDVTYGQIVNMIDLPSGGVHIELERIFQNFDLWERRYILPLVRETVTDDPHEMPKKLASETIFPGINKIIYIFDFIGKTQRHI